MTLKQPIGYAWLLAIRLKTLPAAAAPVIVGSALAFSNGGFRFVPAFVCLLTALLLQIGSNLANDVFDFEKGADAGERLGPIRVTQAGYLTPKQVKRGMWSVFGVSALLGVYLTFQGGWPILILGVAAIISAILYTGGPLPLGYIGLGDIFVFIFFGLAATAGTYYVLVGFITIPAWLMAVSMGLLTVNLLVVNNIRDLEIDRQVGKKTLAVRLGKDAAKIEYIFCYLGSFSIPIFLVAGGRITAWALIVLFVTPMGILLIRTLYKETGQILNKVLSDTGRLELYYGILFSMGVLLGEIFP